MAPTVMGEERRENGKLKLKVQRLQSELEALKKEFAARLSALEAPFPRRKRTREVHVSVETLGSLQRPLQPSLARR